MRVLSDRTLRIESVEASDAGTYICVAKNEVGTAEAVAKLSVRCKYLEFFNECPSTNTFLHIQHTSIQHNNTTAHTFATHMCTQHTHVHRFTEFWTKQQFLRFLLLFHQVISKVNLEQIKRKQTENK